MISNESSLSVTSIGIVIDFLIFFIIKFPVIAKFLVDDLSILVDVKCIPILNTDKLRN